MRWISMMSGADESEAIKLRVEDERHAQIDQCFEHHRIQLKRAVFQTAFHNSEPASKAE